MPSVYTDKHKIIADVMETLAELLPKLDGDALDLCFEAMKTVNKCGKAIVASERSTVATRRRVDRRPD